MDTPTLSNEYFAGFFDADGAVRIENAARSNVNGKYYVLCAEVYNTNIDVINKFKMKYGGTIRGPRIRENCKPIWSWRVHAQVAENFLKSVLPYLIVKYDRAKLGLEFRKLFKSPNNLKGNFKIKDDRYWEKRNRVMASRKNYYEQMKTLNVRGVA